jgi:hypothetical protein
MSLQLPYETNLHEYGYYQVGDIKFLVKNDALLFATKTKQDVTWNFNNEYFSSFDWTIEPSESLADLYAERAVQLRQKYDYLVLHYSGGNDSNNIVETFIKNKIHLDELIIRAPKINEYDISDGLSADNMLAEVKEVAYPLAKIIKDQYMPNIKITILDTAPFIENWLQKNKNWFDDFTWVTDPSNIIRSNFDMLDDNLIKMAERGLKIGHITGHDKPKISKKGDSYYSFFNDIITTRGYITPRVTNRDLPYYFEFFYWHKDAVKLLIKQAHTLVQAEENGRINRPPVYPITNAIEQQRNEKEWRIYEDQVSTEIYPERIFPRSWTAVKPMLKTINDDHSWIYRHENNEIFENWKRNMEKFHSSVDTRFHRKGNLFFWGVTEFISQQYRIK